MIATTIIQLISLFVLYYWSYQCRCLIKLLMKWAQFIITVKSLQQENQWWSNLSCSLVFHVLLRHTTRMIGEGFNLFDECAARCVHLFPQEECTSSSWGDSKMYTSSSIANSQRMQTEINESGTIAKIRIRVENDTVR